MVTWLRPPELMYFVHVCIIRMGMMIMMMMSILYIHIHVYIHTYTHIYIKYHKTL